MADIITSPVTIDAGASSVQYGLLAAGAAFAIDTPAQLINATWNLGLDKATALDTKVNDLAAELVALLNDPDKPTHIDPSTAASATITEPVVTIPTTIDTSTIMATFNDTSLDLISQFQAKVIWFQTNFFPNDATNYAQAETFFTTALANAHGLPTAVAAQIYTDEHDRHIAEATRAKDSIAASFATRRFPMPPGAMLSAQLQIDQKAQDLSAETGRKITTMSVENLRWAAEKVLSLRQLAMGEALDYAKMLAVGPTVSASVTGIGYDAQSKLIGAVSSYYGARNDAAKVINAAAQFNASATQDAAVKNQMADLTLIEDRVKALMANISAIAQEATSLFNNLHTGATVAYNVSGGTGS